MPDWIGNFQNPDFPRLFAAYAGAFAERFPWVQLYTPINEMFICAVFSAKYGWWNEQKKDDTRFVTALKHLVKANVMAMIEILKRRHDAIFIQSESSEYYHAEFAGAIGRAEVLEPDAVPQSLDLNYGRRVDSGMYQYLLDNGMTREEYHWFLDHRLKQHCIFGNDYYQLNEHRVFADGHTVAAGETFGYAEITRQYYNRYRLPVMHTETNLWEGPHGDEAVKWLWKEWANVLRLRNVGIPTVGFTWYILTDQVDWDTALREQNGNVNPLGLFDLDRKIRNVGKAYKQLIADWRNVLPASERLPGRADQEDRRVSTTRTMPPAATSAAAAPRRSEAEAVTAAQDRQDRDLLRPAALAVRPRRERRRRVRLGRSEPGRLGRGGRRRVRGVPRPLHRRRPVRHRGHLAGRLSRRLLSRRRGVDVGAGRASSRRCGTSRAACSACRHGRCSAARCATRCAPTPGSAATGRTRSPRPPKARKAQGFTAVKMNATAELDWIGTPKLFDEVVKRVEAAQAQGMDVGLDFHGRVHRPLAKQLAKVLEPLGLLFIEEPLLSENLEGLREIAAHDRDADRARRAALSAAGSSSRSSSRARSTSSSPTSATPAASSRCARSRRWPRPMTSRSRRIARSGRWRSAPACRSRPARRTMRSRRSASASTTTPAGTTC